LALDTSPPAAAAAAAATTTPPSASAASWGSKEPAHETQAALPGAPPAGGTAATAAEVVAGGAGVAVARGGLGDTEEALRLPLDAAAFRRALTRLDFEQSDALGTLTEAEVNMLIRTCDRNGDDSIDGREWVGRFGSALRRLSGENLISDAKDTRDDLIVADAALTPRCLEQGRWPSRSEWGVSDHGVLTSSFARACPPASDRADDDDAEGGGRGNRDGKAKPKAKQQWTLVGWWQKVTDQGVISYDDAVAGRGQSWSSR
jgi:hypothetical protein